MKGYWFQPTDEWMETHQEELLAGLDCTQGRITKIGISNSGNIKYILNDKNSGKSAVYSKVKTEFPKDLLEQLQYSKHPHDTQLPASEEYSQKKEFVQKQLKVLRRYIKKQLDTEFPEKETNSCLQIKKRHLEIYLTPMGICMQIPIHSFPDGKGEEVEEQSIQIIDKELKRAIGQWVQKENEKRRIKAIKKLEQDIRRQIMKVLSKRTGYAFLKNGSDSYQFELLESTVKYKPVFSDILELDIIITSEPDGKFSKYKAALKQDKALFIKKESERIFQELQAKEFALNPPISSGDPIKAMAHEFNIWNTEWLTGMSYMDEQNMEEYLTLSGDRICRNAAGTMITRNKKVHIIPSVHYAQFKKNEKKKLTERCMGAAKEAFQDYKVTCASNAKGLLYGDTTLTFSRGQLSISYHCSMPSHETSVTNWKKNLQKIKKEVELQFQKAIEKQEQELLKQYAYYTDNFLVQSVYRFIQDNEKYITETAVVQAMRGTKVQLQTEISYTGTCRGMYRLLDETVILEVIENMRKLGWIENKTLKGTYGKFDILKIKTKIPDLPKHLQRPIQDLLLKLRRKEMLTDPEALYVMDTIFMKAELNGEDYMDLYHLIQNPNVVCCSMEYYKSTFAKAPKEVLQFLKIQKELSDNKTTKKILSFVLQKEKKREGKN